MRYFFICCSVFFCTATNAQSIADKLSAAMNKLEKDEQFKHAIFGMYVVNGKTGDVVYERNAEVGLVPASCQKVLTSAAAFELLGKGYKYKTELGYDGEIKANKLSGDIYIIGYGDPTLGSWRWNTTGEKKVLENFVSAIQKKGVKEIGGSIFGYDRKWTSNNTPDGWVWEDIGNYYGAGASSLNWRENQYDIVLKSGERIGDKVRIEKIVPRLENVNLYNELTTAKKGSGDNAYIYLPPYANNGYIRGTIPLGEDTFTISGAMPNAAEQLAFTFAAALKDKRIEGALLVDNGMEVGKKDIPVSPTIISTLFSPPLDSINYWFLKKSINLYGEAFVKTIAYEKSRSGSTDTGIAIIKYFWKEKGIDPSALQIIDGSGLSPANRITPHALVTVMQYAKRQDWFTSFYTALPEMNGIKMKDGYIGGVRSYTGYIKAKDGNEYIFSFIVNNFDGSAGTVREKMWKVLDVLK